MRVDVRSSVQREAKALGDPTRHRIFRYIADAPAPVGVAELTAHTGLNHNAVRQHLGVLKEARLVVEEVEGRGRPGRPRLLYRLNPEAAGTWGTAGPYEYLAGLLAEAVQEGTSAREVGREAGRREAAALDIGTDPLGALEAEMGRRGFRPVRLGRTGRTEFVLERCPFEDVAAINPDTVCQLHLGLAEGLAEGVGGFDVVRLSTRNPRHGGCRVTLREQPGRPATPPAAVPRAKAARAGRPAVRAEAAPAEA